MKTHNQKRCHGNGLFMGVLWFISWSNENAAI